MAHDTLTAVDNLTAALARQATVRAALAAGVKHFDRAGRLLASERDVLTALYRDGSVSLDSTVRGERFFGADFQPDLERPALAQTPPAGIA
ncbi:hypothetical protein [Azospirillum sp. sgz302134]